jgi:hypothetical protein
MQGNSEHKIISYLVSIETGHLCIPDMLEALERPTISRDNGSATKSSRPPLRQVLK